MAEERGEEVAVVPRDERYTDLTPDNSQSAVATTVAAVKKRRPARRQADARRVQGTQAPGTGQVFNIWYGKWSGGDRQDDLASQTQAESKCDPVRDSGWTQADKKPGSYFCLFFARGCCPHGPDCLYLHRLPQPTDLFPPNVDCFGRDKHADYRDDMGGVGSFLRQNHTLYVGRITTTNDIEEQVANAFCLWGQVERIRVLNSRGIAFVTYLHQNAAEFAKEAMAHQSLASNEVLNVRWASQDPNPQAAERDKRRAEEQAAAAIRKALPQAFLDELEGTGNGKRKRDDFGLEGYQPPDAVWYQRGQSAVNPAGRTKQIEGAVENDEGEADQGATEQETGLVAGRALQALKQLQERKRQMTKAPARTATATATAKAAFKKPGLVAYDSDSS